jgi:agmatine deiminase
MMRKTIVLILTVSFLTACNKENSVLNTPNIERSEILNALGTEGGNFDNLAMTATTATTYTMPGETQPHEGTWLQWPHAYQYGTTYRNRLDATWVAMTKALVPSEKVHIIAYSTTEKTRITTLLQRAGVSLTNIDFKIFQTNDVWVRDNGPIYVKDATGKMLIQDWGFNGWGRKTPYAKDNVIPASVATSQVLPKIDLNSSLILEGGAFEIDGNGTFLATKSAILNANRNPNKTQSQVEAILSQNLGVSNFIWLTGVPNADLTDMHIDGFARFGNANTIVTMSNADLTYWEVPSADITRLLAAKNKNGVAYNFVKLPLTKNNVVTTYGKNLGYKGSYVNYYTGNTVVLVPNYNDPNDAVANRILQELYPTKTVVGIDCRNLYANGGMVHCVTQQQPR